MRPLSAEFGTKEDDRLTAAAAGTTPVIRIDVKVLKFVMKKLQGINLIDTQSPQLGLDG